MALEATCRKSRVSNSAECSDGGDAAIGVGDVTALVEIDDAGQLSGI